MRADWLLQLTQDNPDSPLIPLTCTPPTTCLDPLLLASIYSHLGFTSLVSPIPSNPLIPLSLPLSSLDT